MEILVCTRIHSYNIETPALRTKNIYIFIFTSTLYEISPENRVHILMNLHLICKCACGVYRLLDKALESSKCWQTTD